MVVAAVPSADSAPEETKPANCIVQLSLFGLKIRLDKISFAAAFVIILQQATLWSWKTLNGSWALESGFIAATALQ